MKVLAVPKSATAAEPRVNLTTKFEPCAIEIKTLWTACSFPSGCDHTDLGVFGGFEKR